MNLVTNARDAMPEGGELSIGLKEIFIDVEYSYTHPLVKPGDYVLICVSDTGTGMDEGTKQKKYLSPFSQQNQKEKEQVWDFLQFLGL